MLTGLSLHHRAPARGLCDGDSDRDGAGCDDLSVAAQREVHVAMPVASGAVGADVLVEDLLGIRIRTAVAMRDRAVVDRVDASIVGDGLGPGVTAAVRVIAHLYLLPLIPRGAGGWISACER